MKIATKTVQAGVLPHIFDYLDMAAGTSRKSLRQLSGEILTAWAEMNRMQQQVAAQLKKADTTTPAAAAPVVLERRRLTPTKGGQQ